MTTLYRFFDANDRLLYVGITDRGPRRWHEHQIDKPWWTDVASVKVEHHDTRTSARRAEVVAIREELPLHNVSCRSAAQSRKAFLRHDFLRLLDETLTDEYWAERGLAVCEQCGIVVAPELHTLAECLEIQADTHEAAW